MASVGSPDPARTLWDQLVRAQALALPHMHRLLRSRHGLSLSEYTVLQQLAGAADGEATMTQLQASVHMSAAGITRVVASLCELGLVSRSRRQGDRRLMHARLTAVGRRRCEAATHTVDGRLRLLLGERPDDAAIAATSALLLNLGNAVSRQDQRPAARR